MEAELPSFVTSAPDGGELHNPADLFQENAPPPPPFPQNTIPDGPQSRSGR
jgi:hypothetical protein